MTAVRPLLRLVVADEEPSVPACSVAARIEEADRLWQAGESDQSLAVLRACTDDEPQHVELWKLLGWRLLQLDDWNAAAACYETVVRLDPQDVQGLIQLAAIETHRKQPAAAAAVYERLRPHRPADPRLLCNLSYLYEQSGDLPFAEKRARDALAISPTLPEAWNNLGIALREQHELPAAQANFCKAATLRPGFALAEFNRATTGLLQGRYCPAWPGYEQRQHLPEATTARPGQPIWTGGRLSRGTLLVYSDQGSGDAFQFVRFLPAIRELAQAPIRLQVPATMVELLRGIAGADEIVTEETFDSSVTVCVALGSLAYHLQLDLADLPVATNYITSPRDLPEPLNRLLPITRDSSRPRIGLVWQGNPRQQRDFVRSCPLNALLPLAARTDCDWYSLQLGERGRGQLPDIQGQWSLIDLAAHLTDWSITAGVLARLDLLISVDTAVAHLAGALGRPVWTLLTHTPDWRYGLSESTTPWYPTMQLFRQPRRGDWTSVVEEILLALNML